MDNKYIAKFEKRHYNYDDENISYCPQKATNTYYQICQYADKNTGKYSTRKILFDENGVIIKKYEKEYDKTKVNKFMALTSANKYKVIATNDIALVGLPQPEELFGSTSQLINNKYKSYGFADF